MSYFIFVLTLISRSGITWQQTTAAPGGCFKGVDKGSIDKGDLISTIVQLFLSTLILLCFQLSIELAELYFQL